MDEHALDIRGLLCPITWARVRQRLKNLKVGQHLRVQLDHRPALTDIRRNAEDLGHEVLGAREVGEGEWVIEIEVGAEE